MYQIAKLPEYSYRFGELKKSFVVDTHDGTELGWCRSIKVVCFFYLTKECYIELEFFRDGCSTLVGYSLGRYFDLEPQAKQYTYQDVLNDLHLARRAWLEAPTGLGKRMYNSYMALARLQPYLLEQGANWNWAEYRTSICLHLLSTVDEPSPHDGVLN